MEEYLNKNIKEIIEKFPQVGKVLERFNIGCVNCSLATCLLKDVIEIHNLSEKEEEDLFKEIGKIIYPDGKFKIPKLKREIKEKMVKLSPVMEKLKNEHQLIKEFLSNIHEILDNYSDEKSHLLLKCTEFIKNFADKYHHAKEEDILFKYFDQNIEIINVMKKDHENARNYVKNIVSGIEKKDEKTIKENFLKYEELLKEHIKKEDEILYPWMDRNLNISQIGEIFQKFNDVDREFGEDFFEKWRKFIEKIKGGDYGKEIY